MMQYKQTEIADWMIALAKANGKHLGVQSIMKLVYFAHAWMLAIHHRPLLDKPIEAWQYGPVPAEVHKKLRNYRGHLVTKTIHRNRCPLDADDQDIVNQVFTKYGQLNGIELAALCNGQDSPWHETKERLEGQTKPPRRSQYEIPDTLIERYYVNMIDERRANGLHDTGKLTILDMREAANYVGMAKITDAQLQELGYETNAVGEALGMGEIRLPENWEWTDVPKIRVEDNEESEAGWLFVVTKDRRSTQVGETEHSS